MIPLNRQISITPSDELAKMRLSGIIGRRGVVAEQVFSTSDNLIGYMVFLEKSFQGECLWFVPTKSVEDETNSL